MYVAVKASQEYLAFLDELLECRDNDRLNLLQNRLQQVIHRESNRISQAICFLKRYEHSIATIHVHGSVMVARPRRFNFCATIQSHVSASAHAAGKSNNLALPHTGAHQIRISVLVDVRKAGEKSQSGVDGAGTVVRLQPSINANGTSAIPGRSLANFPLGNGGEQFLGSLVLSGNWQ